MFLYSLMRFYIGINGVLSRDALTDNYTVINGDFTPDNVFNGSLRGF